MGLPVVGRAQNLHPDEDGPGSFRAGQGRLPAVLDLDLLLAVAGVCRQPPAQVALMEGARL